jgi:hypothetical protein
MVLLANEELQSTNENADRQKKPQSANEERATLSEEFALRNAELVRVNGDLENLLSLEVDSLFASVRLTR